MYLNPEANSVNFNEVEKTFRNNKFEHISSYFSYLWSFSKPGVKIYVENNIFANISSSTANIDLFSGYVYFRNNIFNDLTANLPVQLKVDL